MLAPRNVERFRQGRDLFSQLFEKVRLIPFLRLAPEMLDECQWQVEQSHVRMLMPGREASVFPSGPVERPAG